MRQIIVSPKDAHRFWSKVDRSGGPDACWPWLGRLSVKGYGVFDINSRGTCEDDDCPPRVAHRVALAIGGEGFTPERPNACHRCHNRRCVNPAHLYACTQKENIHDCVVAGRHRHGPGLRGEAHPGSKLTWEAVREIRARYTGAYGQQSQLAREYGIARKTLIGVLTGERWRKT